MKKALIVLLSMLAVGACSSDDSQVTPSISPTALVERIRSGNAPLLLDVRSRDEYSQGHIPGAINIPHDELAGRLDELGIDKSEEVVVHCLSGGRAAIAESLLRDVGYKKVLDLDGHWKAWSASKRPTQ